MCTPSEIILVCVCTLWDNMVCTPFEIIYTYYTSLEILCGHPLKWFVVYTLWEHKMCTPSEMILVCVHLWDNISIAYPSLTLSMLWWKYVKHFLAYCIIFLFVCVDVFNTSTHIIGKGLISVGILSWYFKPSWYIKTTWHVVFIL